MKFDHYTIPGVPPMSKVEKWIKPITTFCYSIIGYLFVYFHRPQKKNRKYKVALCAIFKNEALFLREWMEYYLLIGVEHFYLYNNFSDDNYKEILNPYIEKGIVSLFDWPVPHGQESAYQDCWQKYAGESQWIGFIDLDEFVCLRYADKLSDWLKQYNQYPSVLVCWKLFGSAGIVKHDFSKTVIEQYTNSWNNLVRVGKSFVNSDYNNGTIFAHCYFAKIKLFGVKVPLSIPPVNEHKKFVRSWYHAPSLCKRKSTIQLNHYWSRGYDQFLLKNKKGSALAAQNIIYKNNNMFKYIELGSTNSDVAIQRFLIFLKIKLEKQ